MKSKLFFMALAGFLAASVVVALLIAAEQKSQKQLTKTSVSVSGAAPQLVRELKVLRGLSEVERECIACHARQEQGKVRDWSHSMHARANVTCLDCHKAQLTDKDAVDCPGTEKYAEIKITPIVSPQDCSRCHPNEADQFKKSKHARTWDITANKLQDPWLKGMTNDVERAVGCNMCHGSDISDGKLNELNWPNAGCGRKNPDGSNGTCTTCHTTHRFSIAEARKPETCGQCHLGPDHPQKEIYFESKHGKRYLAENSEWKFDVAPDLWEPGADYTAPTCAVCHMSGIGPLATSHELSNRLKWESQAPLSVHNKDKDNVKERQNMITVCRQCHSQRWSENYLARFDKAIENYNENYFLPVKTRMDELYKNDMLTKWPIFDEEIEWVYYEYWHHEGRRARMGSAMMGPDYSWWHGFYELKRSYQHFIKLAEEVQKKGHGSPIYVPGTGGKNLTSAKIKPLPDAWDDVKHLIGR